MLHFASVFLHVFPYSGNHAVLVHFNVFQVLVVITVRAGRFPIATVFQIVNVIIVGIIGDGFARIKVGGLTKATATSPQVCFWYFFTVTTFWPHVIF